MRYSKNPKDWYFDVQGKDEVVGELSALMLTPYKDMLDDELGGWNLPQEIKDLLAPLGVNAEEELLESIFEIDSESTEEELIASIKALGFNHVNFEDF